MVVTHAQLKKLIGNAKVVGVPKEPEGRKKLFEELLRNRPNPR